MTRLPLSVLHLVLWILPAAAQDSAITEVMRLCGTPPLSVPEISMIERRADFPALMDGMAMRCPEVAMLFAQWMVGEVDHAPHQPVHRHPPDFLHHLVPDCPVGEVASVPAF